ncbi:hypothetical protein BCR44DRAFT_179182 [Catenaria anguillulae PL171]|uniref:Protein kinase domain-containing protein n=1 Tax=Catenaria anguillulae PL171 TaxID=765915 RepID=A0A1Y2H845_9FUNG|nr:hypothetical protein BCR44DRAFT_179182 [Catenaria anguillulae PL171]
MWDEDADDWELPGATSKRIKTSEWEAKTCPHLESFSADARDFVARLLIKDPAQRMTVMEASKHPWLTSRQSTINTIESPNVNVAIRRTEPLLAGTPMANDLSMLEAATKAGRTSGLSHFRLALQRHAANPMLQPLVGNVCKTFAWDPSTLGMTTTPVSAPPSELASQPVAHAPLAQPKASKRFKIKLVLGPRPSHQLSHVSKPATTSAAPPEQLTPLSGHGEQHDSTYITAFPFQRHWPRSQSWVLQCQRLQRMSPTTLI